MAIPAKVVVNPRARVTAGLAKEVEDVNQYAAVITRPPRNGVGSIAKTAKDGQHQGEGCDHFGEPLRGTAPSGRANHERRKVKHQMSNDCPATAPAHCTRMYG